VNKKEYKNIHAWLKRHHGKPTNCQDLSCEKKSTIFQWALIKGKDHSRNKDNYIWLCSTCHNKYDYDRVWTKETRDKVRTSRLGKPLSEETKRKKSVAMSGDRNPMYGVTNQFFLGKHHSHETRLKISKFRRKISDSDLDDLRTLYQLGVKQRLLAFDFGLSPASVNRIVKNKRYCL